MAVVDVRIENWKVGSQRRAHREQGKCGQRRDYGDWQAG
jgi:hypothetical protein